jgi:Domain of unknown function (DUF4166)
MKIVIAVPGRIPLERRRFSLVDVPDLRALLLRWPDAQDVWMGAAPVPMSLHRALIAFAWLVRLRLLPRLSWMAPAIHAVTNHAHWGEDRGGMFVEVKGLGPDGGESERTWHLLAEGRDGPLIPSMAIEAIVRSTLSGKLPAPGARPAIADVSLSQYEAMFAKRSIYTGVREPVGTEPLYRRVLGSAWDRLPPPIRHLHSVTSSSSFVGRCEVERGRNPLGWVVAALIEFPSADASQSIVVRLEADGDGERWVRTIGSRTFSSYQRAGCGPSDWLVTERFGAISVDMALVATDGGLSYGLATLCVVGGHWAFRCPCGLVLAPSRWSPPRTKPSRSMSQSATASPDSSSDIAACCGSQSLKRSRRPQRPCPAGVPTHRIRRLFRCV